MANDFDFSSDRTAGVYSPRKARRMCRDNKPPLSRGVYILLGLFLGLFGVHNFYAKRIGVGVCQLILSFLVVPIPLVMVWVLIELATVERDGYGDYFS